MKKSDKYIYGGIALLIGGIGLYFITRKGRPSKLERKGEA